MKQVYESMHDKKLKQEAVNIEECVVFAALVSDGG